jgi:ribosomal protein S27AE
MPIRPETAHRYPANWAEIRAAVLARARNRCENCGVANHALGGRLADGRWLAAWPLGEKMLRLEWPCPGETWWCGDGTTREQLRIIRIVLTIAHLDHTPENCSLDNLRALCQRCHLAYDQPHHLQQAYANRRRGFALGDLFDAEHFA